MKSKSLFASILAAVSIQLLAAVPAQAVQNVPQVTPDQQVAGEPARVNTLAVNNASEGCTNPAYPTPSSRQLREGSVKMRFLVDGQGNVKDADIVRSSGSSVIDNASMAALRKCSFHPQADQQAAEPKWQEVKYVWSRD